ncbi:protein-glutamine gamma-glutamyltransferase K-like [Argonauta hians]
MDSASPDPKRRRYFFRYSSGDSAENGRTNAISDLEYMNKSKNLRKASSSSKETLKVSSLDLHLESNRKCHHTDEYDQTNLIIRRGSSFILSITFQRKVIKEIDDVIFQFSVGTKPQESKGSLIRINLFQDLRARNPNKLKQSKWAVKYLNIEEETIKVEVTPPVTSPIGEYNLYVETRNADEKFDETERYLHSETLILLFNPWCKDDSVFMEDEKLLDEYILNETGRIWIGSSNGYRGRPWNFGQFQEPCLSVALLLLRKAGLPVNAKRDPVEVIRCLTAMTNGMDEGGLLEGRWAKTFPKPCTLPFEWSGSTAIISEYAETSQSVRYGQCWVFSGLMTTLLRALGIPTRSVTNFQSAHDNDASISIDVHFDENSKPIKHLNDSVWNFHVWNESWLRRPDLPDGYDGWQAHDATPQEESGGVMRCGPSPVKAIKEGDVYLNYDTPFIFSEVNGDKVYWMVNEKTDEMKVVHINKSAVGKNISTKAVGSTDREDITCHYKYKEGSKEERNVVKKAMKFASSKHDDIYGDEGEDVSFEIVDLKKAIMGESFTVGLKILSKSSVRTIKTSFTVMTSFYTGVTDKSIFSQEDTVTAQPNQEKIVKLTLSPDDYESKINYDGAMSIFVVAKVEETKQVFVDEHNVVPEKPGLVLKCPEDIRHGEIFDLTITFTNPLKTEMENLVYHIEGSGVRKPFTITGEKKVAAGAEVTKVAEIYAYKYGTREIIVTLSSDNMGEVEGSVNFRVKYSF